MARSAGHSPAFGPTFIRSFRSFPCRLWRGLRAGLEDPRKRGTAFTSLGACLVPSVSSSGMRFQGCNRLFTRSWIMISSSFSKRSSASVPASGQRLVEAASSSFLKTPSSPTAGTTFTRWSRRKKTRCRDLISFSGPPAVSTSIGFLWRLGNQREVVRQAV